MQRPGISLRLAAGLLCCVLAGCATMSLLFGGSPIRVEEVRRLSVCNSDGPQPKVTLFTSPDAVLAWQHVRGVDLVGSDPLPPAGAYVLAEMGVHDTAGYGLAISRAARIGGGFVRLSATLFYPEPGQASAPATVSPCVLVALPQSTAYRGIELRDPAGNLLAEVEAPPGEVR